MIAPLRTRRLRTLQIGVTASTRHVSGTDRYFLSLLRELPAHGVDVDGVVLGDPGALPDPVPNVASFAPEGANRWRRWSGLRFAITRRLAAADCVVSHAAAHAFPALDAIGDRPLIVHFHGPWALEAAADGKSAPVVAIRRLQERSVYARGRRFIVLSRAFGAILEREYRIEPDALRIIPGGVDTSRFTPRQPRRSAREALGWPTDRPIVATARRLVPTKGLENFIDAVALARRAVPDLFGVLVGSGPLEGELRRRIAERGLDEHVRIVGHVDEARFPLIYRAADLIVVPTLQLEGFGLVVPEALASGTPVLVTPVGGLPEAVRELSEALILDGSTTDDVARGIRDALLGVLPLPAEASCLRYAARFDWSSIAEAAAAVYREVV